MASMQDRLKLKRVNCDAWTIREQLCLASSVLKSGDQNWMSVSRSLKPFIEKESLRPPDWFSQKSCAMQYASLLENVDTPKRKKRESGETTSESIVRRLTQERITELSQTLACQKEEYLRLKADISLLKSGAISDEKLEKMWLEIQQEERETDQKTRAHMAWLTKRQQQQKQEMSLSPIIPSSIANQTRKHAESTIEVAQPEFVFESTSENDDERKNNRGGRSPLLTSLLKSPSPTTQAVQTYPSTPVQVSSPTITSLLGSNSKILNAQLTQNVSPQLQQLVSTAIASANATSPSSVGAPTLSMLLEMPATAQRGPLPKLQTTSVGIVSQQQQATAAVAATSSIEMHKFEQTIQPQSQIRQMNIQNEVANAATVTMPTATTISAAAATALTAVVTAPTNVPVSENMVQIIDHIDDVLRKDIMADVMDKDEINEIIGDIEELIKEEITGSPQTLDASVSTMTTTTSTVVISNLSSMPRQIAEIPIVVPKVEPKPEPRDVDETVSLSDSPRSEMAIEEIDSSTSNIAEIIGTVAIEPQEPKIIVAEITEIISNTPEEIKSETNTCDDERVALTEELVPELETNDGENSKDTPMEEKQSDIEIKSVDTVSSNVEVNNSKLPDETKEAMEDTVVETEIEEEDRDKEEETEVIAHDNKESSESIKELKESPEDTEGDQQDVPSTEVISVSSEVTNDLTSTEDTEKSQDISLILEDDESSQNSENKKKAEAEEQIIENTVESTESLESFKEDSILIKEKIIAEVKEESLVKSQEEEAIEETLEIYTDEFKKEEVKDSSEDTTSSILQDAEIKEEEIDSEPVVLSAAENTSPVVTVEEVKSIKNEPIEVATADADITNIKKIESAEVKPEEPKTESEIDVTNAFCTKSPLPPEEDKKEIVEIKQEKEDTKKNAESEQSIKKEMESTEEPVELDEEESSLSKLSGGRAMKTYSKKQNITVDSEPENEGTGEGADYRAWKKAVMLVYNRLATHKYASVFLRPITEDQAPGYHSVIFRPMDLSTIKKNIDNGTIRSTMHFQRDVMLMFQNAIMYNKHDTFIYKMAVSMQEECLQHMQILVQVTGEGSFRRETRTAASSSSEASESSIKRKRSHITPSPHDTDSPRSKKRRKSEND
ncbi:bromodomain-containing protein 8 isoform X2 [Polyergus mexicanus]|uniref:bromodomain-containing protein 8 isoform X2 n=1 Tax=Polyergus mexicanus TaxID=615972 RepID=UPI0038B45ECE